MKFFWQKEKRNADFVCDCEESKIEIGGLNFLQKLLGNQDIPVFLDAFFSALQLISNTIAQLPLYFTDKKQEETPSSLNFYDILFNHNLLNKFNLVKNFITDLYRKGNAFLYINRDESGKPVSLMYLDANDVNIRYIKQKNIVYYNAPLFIKGQIPAENMIHIFMNTEEIIEGKSLSYYASKILKLAGFSEKQAEEYFASGCNVSGVLTYQGNLTDKQKNEIRDNWRQTHGNGKGGIAVLPGSMNYHQLGSNAKDAQLLETRLFNVQSVARYFNISPVLLGDLSHSSFNSLEQSQLQLLINCISPILRLIEEEFNRKLYPGKLYLHFNENAILRTDKQSESNYYTNLVTKGILSVNEAREEMGYKKIDKPEYDELIIPYTKIQDNKIENGGTDNNNDINNDNKEPKDKNIDKEDE